MSLLLVTGEQAIVELNSDLFNSTILTTKNFILGQV